MAKTDECCAWITTSFVVPAWESSRKLFPASGLFERTICLDADIETATKLTGMLKALVWNIVTITGLMKEIHRFKSVDGNSSAENMIELFRTTVWDDAREDAVDKMGKIIIAKRRGHMEDFVVVWTGSVKERILEFRWPLSAPRQRKESLTFWFVAGPSILWKDQFTVTLLSGQH